MLSLVSSPTHTSSSLQTNPKALRDTFRSQQSSQHYLFPSSKAFLSLPLKTSHLFKTITATTSSSRQLFTRFKSSPFCTSGNINGHATSPDQDPLFPSAEFGFPYVVEGSRESVNIVMDDGYVHARIDMPGVKKEGLKVWLDKNVLHFEGEETIDDRFFNKETSRKFKGNLLCVDNFDPKKVKVTDADAVPVNAKEISAVLSNGVLKIRLPHPSW